MTDKLTAASADDNSFSELTSLIRATDGLSLAQVCSLTGLEPSTVQNWIKRGFVPHPVRKRYGERHVARILLISELRECMLIERVGELMRYINGNADDTGDDIIDESALYDLFRDASRHVAERYLPPDRVGEAVAQIVSNRVTDPVSRERIIPALTVMAVACIAARYKGAADKMYSKMFE